MRKILAILVVMITLYSCEKDVAPIASPIQAQLNGLWEVKAYSFTGRTSTLELENYSYFDFTGIAGNMSLFMEFNDDGSYEFYGFYYLGNTIVTDEGITYYYVDYFEVDQSGIWTLDDNIIELDIDGEIIDVGISNLNNTELILRINTSTSEIEEDNITTVDTNKQETYVLERQ